MDNVVSEKSYDHACNNTLARTRNVIDNVHVNVRFPMKIMFILKAIKFHLKGSYDKTESYTDSWSFHMKL